MAYSIQITSHYGDAARERLASVVGILQEVVTEAGFSIGEVTLHSTFRGTNRRGRQTEPAFKAELRVIRLAEAKPYCGQHPGECEFPNRKKPRARFLEWDDWVRFNGLVNDVLDCVGKTTEIAADVWSKPTDAAGRFWIRRLNKRRTRYDYTETFNGMGRAVRVWNLGNEDDQYVPQLAPTCVCGGTGRVTEMLRSPNGDKRPWTSPCVACRSGEPYAKLPKKNPEPGETGWSNLHDFAVNRAKGVA